MYAQRLTVKYQKRNISHCNRLEAGKLRIPGTESTANSLRLLTKTLHVPKTNMYTTNFKIAVNDLKLAGRLSFISLHY